jgi:hypothetical protein
VSREIIQNVKIWFFKILLKGDNPARCQMLMPVIQASQEKEIRRIVVGNQPGQTVTETQHKTGLAEWLKW